MPGNRVTVRRPKRRVNFQRRKMANPSSTIVNYRGPIITRAERSDTNERVVVLHELATVTSSGAGVLNAVYGSNPSASSNWSSMASAFDEYRTLGMQIRYMPFNRYNKVTTSCIPLLAVLDYNDASSLTSTTDATQYQSVLMKSLEDPHSMTIKMSELTAAAFTTTASPVNLFYIKIYASGLSLSTGYGYYLISRRVQFRSTGI